VPRVRRWLGDLLAGWRLAEPDAADLALAVTEVCTNIARHGYRGAAGELEVQVQPIAGRGNRTVLVKRQR
jgi:anti-sigma regulatory factor (Ser/Thr protein kinase)